MKYKHIIFDLDGTLTDPKEGITEAVKFALNRMGVTIPSQSELEDFIGPPLFDSFVDKLSMTPGEALKAVDLYRQYYADKGLYENNPYPGIKELLKTLKEADVRLYVATSKPEIYARKILSHFDLDQYFDVIAGSTLDGSISHKGEVLDYLDEQCHLKSSGDVLMVGDRKFDIQGAKSAGFDSVGVLYGYGSKQEIEAHTPKFIIDKPERLIKVATEG